MPDIGRELQLTPATLRTPGNTPAETESTRGARATTRSLHPVIAAALGLLIATIIGVICIGTWIVLSRDDQSPTANPATGEGSGSPVANLPARQLDAAIETTARGYLEAGNQLARCHWIVGGQDTLAALREYHSRPGVKAPKSFGHILDIGPAAFDGFPAQMVAVAENDGVTGHLLITELIHNHWVDVNRLRRLSKR